ncbi:hypothetical protein [Burkholderia sp. BCC1988]|uniref:hypothetical protein n=1 Tax=Burkholderia sp. BCC1988 TaxID=2817443 RepID=UPI002AB24B33|nr:hypothetical protein [Burkholderia sp. BCC1988]
MSARLYRRSALAVRMRGAPDFARRPEVRTKQVSRAIGRRRSPVKGTAFFFVAIPGCPHPASRIRPHPVALTGEMHSLPSGFEAGISTTDAAKKFIAGAAATSVHAPARDRRRMPESPANSAS